MFHLLYLYVFKIAKGGDNMYVLEIAKGGDNMVREDKFCPPPPLPPIPLMKP